MFEFIDKMNIIVDKFREEYEKRCKNKKVLKKAAFSINLFRITNQSPYYSISNLSLRGLKIRLQN